MNHWPLQSECPKFYGDPDANDDFRCDEAWQRENLTKIAVPWKIYTSWPPVKQMSGLWMHKKVAASHATILQIIWDFYHRDQIGLEAGRMHLSGGAFNFRLMRGGALLSMHSYGIAVDWDPERNPLGKAWDPIRGVPRIVIDAYKSEGWTWGGDWHKRPDPQHFQAARVM